MSENAEIINTNEINVEDNGKTFEIVKREGLEPREAFMDANNFVPMLNKIKELSHNLIADVHTKEGVEVRKTLAKKIAKLRTSIEKDRKAVADEVKKMPKIIDATGKAVRETLELYESDVMAPIVAIEKRKAEIIEISNVPASAIGGDSYIIEQIIESLTKYDHDAAYWDESHAEALDAIKEARRQLNDMLASAKKAEAEKAELERLRAQEAEMARAKAAEEERKRKEAEEALRKANEEAARAKAEAERIRKEAEAKVDFVQSPVANKLKTDAEKTKSTMLFEDDRTTYIKTCNHEAVEDLMKSSGVI